MSALLKSKIFWTLTALVFLGLCLRLYSFSSITFGYDQARDAFIAQDIFLKGDLKILGPSSDIHGLHHGVLYWYLISPFYAFSYGGVFAVKIFVILVGLLSIPLTYILAKKMFNDSWVAMISAFFIAVSYEAISYSHWLSNPSFAFVTILLSFLFLWMYVKENFKYGLFATAFFWGLSVQFEIFLLYQAVVFLIILILFRKINVKDIFISFFIFALTILPLILGEIKFGYPGILGILSFFTGYAGERGQTISEMGSRANDKLFRIPYYNFLSSTGASFIFAFLLLAVGIIYSVLLKDKRVFFLTLWFVSPVVLFFTGSTNIYFVFIGCAIPLAILTAFYLRELFIQKKAYLPCVLLLLLVFGSNIYLLYENKGKGETLFSVQKDMVYDTQTKMLDFIYEEAGGKPFRINTITNPLFINTTWSFLFDSYGRKTYGYMPFYWGYPQNGQFGEGVQYSKDFKGSKNLIFLIHEPSGGIPDFYRNGIIKFEDTRSRVIKSKMFGEFRVEKRIITVDKPFLKEEIDESIKNNDLRDVRLKGLE